MYVLRQTVTRTVDDIRDYAIDQRFMDRLYTYLGEKLDMDCFEMLIEITPDDVAAIWRGDWDKCDYIVWCNSPLDDDDPYEIELYFVIRSFLENEFRYVEGEMYGYEFVPGTERNDVYWED